MSDGSLYVAVLPCSQLIFVEPFRDEKLPAWIAGHVHAFEYIGGVPKTLVPDNLKSGVKRPIFFEPELNKTYQEMASNYGAIILPARVRKPRDYLQKYIIFKFNRIRLYNSNVAIAF